MMPGLRRREERVSSPCASTVSLAGVLTGASALLAALGAALGPLYVLGLFVVQRELRIAYTMTGETAWRTALVMDRPRLTLHGMVTAANPSILPVFITLSFFLTLDLFDRYLSQSRGKRYPVTRVSGAFRFKYFASAMMVGGLSGFLLNAAYPDVNFLISIFVALISGMLFPLAGLQITSLVSKLVFNVLSVESPLGIRSLAITNVFVLHVFVSLLTYREIYPVDAPIWLILLMSFVVAVCSVVLSIFVYIGRLRLMALAAIMLVAYIAALFPLYWTHVRPGEFRILPFSTAALCIRGNDLVTVQYVGHSDQYWYFVAPMDTLPGQGHNPLIVIGDSMIHEIPMGTPASIGSHIEATCT